MENKKTFRVEVKPSVLSWLIDSSGWDRNSLIKALRVSERTFGGWLDGTVNPTIAQLERLSDKVKRPLAAFFLSTPIEEKPLPYDFRSPMRRNGKFDRRMILAIRRARFLQSLTQELSENLNKPLKSEFEKHSVRSKPEETADYFRRIVFGLSTHQQVKFKKGHDFYKFLREKIEELGVVPSQVSTLVDNVGCFVLADELPSVIVVSSKQELKARTTSLIRGFAYVVIGRSVVADCELRLDHAEKAEEWCDAFASEFIFPKSVSKKVFASDKNFGVGALEKISNKFFVSRDVILYQARSLDLISEEECLDLLRKLKKEKKSGGLLRSEPVEKRRVYEFGKRFVSLVADNYDSDFITYADVLSYLSVRSNEFEDVKLEALDLPRNLSQKRN